jgi:hypothetical protein
MPKGEDFGSNMKQLMFRIIKFVENEKNGPVIPLFNTTGRLEAMLGISRISVFRLRNEMFNLKMNQEDENEQKEKDKLQLRPRSRTVSGPVVSPKVSHQKRKYSIDIPLASSPKKKGHSGRKVVELTEQQQDHIR